MFPDRVFSGQKSATDQNASQDKVDGVGIRHKFETRHSKPEKFETMAVSFLTENEPIGCVESTRLTNHMRNRSVKRKNLPVSTGENKQGTVQRHRVRLIHDKITSFRYNLRI
jgi:hypothetical protein